MLLREGEPRLVATLRAGATPDAEDGGERMLSVPLRETKEVPVALIEEVAGHLRAILRDVLCGHLDPDVRTLADDLIAETAWDEPTAH